MEEDLAKRIYGGSGALAFAVAVIYEMIGQDSKKQGLKDLIGVHYWVILAIFTILFFLLYSFTSPDLAGYFLEHEYYSLAETHLHFANKIAFYNGQLKKIFKDFNTSLKAEMVFTVRFAAGQEETYLVERLPEELRLSSRDSFAFRIDPSEPLFVYIYQSCQNRIFKRLYPQGNEGSRGNVIIEGSLESKVRPEGQVTFKAPVAPDYYQVVPIRNSTTIPGDGIFFKPPARNENWDIYIILSKWRCRNFEKMLFSRNQLSLSLEDIAKYNLEQGSIQVKRLGLCSRD